MKSSYQATVWAETLPAHLQVNRKSALLSISYVINVGVFCCESALLNQIGLLYFAVNSAKTQQLYERLYWNEEEEYINYKNKIKLHFQSSGVGHHVVRQLANNISDEHTASTFKIKLKVKSVSKGSLSRGEFTSRYCKR